MKIIVSMFLLFLFIALAGMELYFRTSNPEAGTSSRTVLIKNKNFVRYHFKTVPQFGPTLNWQGTFDSNEYRIVPETNTSSNDAILFAGCSYTLGVGVPDEKTFVSLVARSFKDKHVFNWGLWGDGPHGQLAHFQEDSSFEMLNHKNVTFIYTLIEDQLLRAAGKYSRAGDPNGPRYEVVDDKLIRKGDWVQEESIFSYLAKSKVALKLGFHQTPSVTNEDIDLNCRLLNKIKSVLKNQVKVSRNLIVLYPGFQHVDEISKCLDNDYEILDLSSLFSISSDYYIPGDGHPNDRAHAEVARKIIEKLNQ